ncbi:hypothetical protein CLV58_1464 [Spirosoma oryzae]|uniref:Plasmid replication protein RepL domain-containing protein n=1 Tax=Spirosoma oryzae TaxID=1469603 RepID=A0A2T0RMD1_9BACT|nr:type IV toxin-antitoxin system AbiEi family antitoxin [Spirosoma oryzae]PRY22291.1 hypothetical protein CLV58_1464 [Spirosoma oryzae]
MDSEQILIQQGIERLVGLVPDACVSVESPAPKGKRYDAIIQLAFGNANIKLALEAKLSARRIVFGQLLNQLADSENPTLLTDYVGAELGEKLRQHAINYIDTVGNVYLKLTINELPFLLWIDGRKPDRRVDGKADHAFTKAGLRVTYWLLINPNRANETIRVIAQEAGGSLETVHRAKASLQDRGFLMEVRRGEWKLMNRKLLLDKWLEAYAARLQPSLLRGRYRLLKNETLADWNLQPLETPLTQWGGEPAADSLTNFLRPATWTLYTRQPTQVVARQLRLLPDAENGLVYLYEKFWPHDDDGLCVHPLLVYADLLISQDPRNHEVAQRLYHTYVQHLLDGTPATTV